MDRFVANFTLRLDSKGRVSVPGAFRAVLVRDGFEGLYCYPALDCPAIDAGGRALIAEIEALIGRFGSFSEERERLLENFRQAMRERIAREWLLDAVAQKESIDATEEELSEEMSRLAQARGRGGSHGREHHLRAEDRRARKEGKQRPSAEREAGEHDELDADDEEPEDARQEVQDAHDDPRAPRDRPARRLHDRREGRDLEHGHERQERVGANLRRVQDRGQRRRNHRRVHVLHEQGGGDDERNEALLVHGWGWGLRVSRAVSPNCHGGHCGWPRHA